MKESLIFELSKPGRRAASLPKTSVPYEDIDNLIPAEHRRQELALLPEVSELDIVRHFTRLSQLNYSVDTVMYPLGSCTMKYNPKVNESIVRNEKWMKLHPFQPQETIPGILKLIYEMQKVLCHICGMDSISLHPAAGAHGELLGLLLIRAYYQMRGEKRTRVIVPDSSHGTNPSSAHLAGFEVITVPSNEKGEIDLNTLENKLDDSIAAMMITNPNTLGIFETRILQISEMLHRRGILLYGDGANMNALLGRWRPGDLGFDVIHLNLHKTFSTPHGGGGPGSGPVLVKKDLEPFLPVPVIGIKKGKYCLSYEHPKSIGKIHSFYGNIGVIIKAYCYIMALGGEGLRKVSSLAVLNANYLKEKLKQHYHLPYDRICMHEFVLSCRKNRAIDIAKRLLDYGFYAPTIYFPLIVPEALMLEPTETESKSILDEFAEAMKEINRETLDILKNAPHNLPVSRMDEVNAARNPDLMWRG